MATTEAGEDLYPLALLMDDLKNDDISNRVEATKKIDQIAIALGPERTRDELLPFLTEVAEDDEDEVFTVLAEHLGGFVPYVGGPQYSSLLLPILDTLAGAEETIVRDRAVQSLNTIAEQMPDDDLFKYFVPLLQRLATDSWFSSKVSACGLFKSVFLKVKDVQSRVDLWNLFMTLVQDETPMVRRAVGRNLPVLIDLLTENPDLCTEKDLEYISSTFQTVINDPQDSVKFLAVDCLISILKFFNKRGLDTHSRDLLNSALALAGDEAWRVRYMVADKFADLTDGFASNPTYINELLEPFLKLCEDNESDVRKAIAKQVSDFSKHIKDSHVILTKIIPVLQSLSMDENEDVRASLASGISDIVLLLQKEQVVEYVFPIFLNMLRDEIPDVRLNIIGKLKVVNDVIGIDMLTDSLLPAISELAKDNSWRVRLAIIEYVPILAEQLGVNFFNSQLSDLCLSWLWDAVYSIRAAAIINLQKLTNIFGSDWCNTEIVPRLLGLDPQLIENFIYRITLLNTFKALVSVLSPDVVANQILPHVLELTSDQVPNIRFNVAKTYPKIVEVLHKDSAKYDALIKDTIYTSLNELCQDPDFDVRYFANESMKECKTIVK
ncbi:Protein phosphatase PP2A regulatory subunit A [Nakaseomyces bracarensis]|uniref:Protein phosphatase PP2A regulatory subunit A n=1 Tax=Nakaseomyces bracarensis TaxID=273131 RepID=A0ABR4NX21_9SACH